MMNRIYIIVPVERELHHFVPVKRAMSFYHVCPLQTRLLRWTHFNKSRSVQRAVAVCAYVCPIRRDSSILCEQTQQTGFKTTNYTSLFLFFLAIACFELYTKILTCFSLWLKYLTITQKPQEYGKWFRAKLKIRLAIVFGGIFCWQYRA